jgi:hypothetical protein
VGAALEWVETSRRTQRWIIGNPLIAITMLRHDLSAGPSRPGGSVAENRDRECKGHCIYKTPLGDAYLQAMASHF